MMIDINGQFRQILPETSRWIDRSWMAGLALASLILMVWQLGLLPLQDGYEGSIAQAARGSLERLDSLGALETIDSALSGLLNTPWPAGFAQTAIPLSPVLSWSLMLSYAIGGVNETTSRLPSALLVASSVPLIYAIARELFAGRLAAVMAAVLYLICLPVVRLGRLATPSGALLFEILLLLLCLFRSRRDIRWSLGLGLVTGLLGLTEGWMGLLWGVFGVAFLAWDTPRLLRCPYLWWGLGLGLLPLGLWGGLSYVYQGGAFMQVVGHEEIAGPIAGSGFRASWGWTVAMQVSFPAVLFLPSALQYAWRNRDFSWAKFLLSWSGLSVLLLGMGVRQNFSIAGLGVYPLVSLLVSVYLAQHWLPHWTTSWTASWTASAVVDWDTDQAIDSSPQFSGASPREIKNWGWIFAVASVVLSCGAGWSLGEGLGWIALSAGLMALSCGAVMVLCRQRRRSEALAVLAWGSYVALFVFVNSAQSLWDSKNDYPVQPVAQMIANRLPSDSPNSRQTLESPPIYTSHGVHRSSLDFYSEHPVIPASMTDLETHLLNDERPFLLVDLDSVRQLPQLKVKFLSQVRVQLQGRSQTWALLTRQGVQK